MRSSNRTEATIYRARLVAIGLTACFAFMSQASAELQCVEKDVKKGRGKVDTVVLMISDKAATRLSNRGFSAVACPISRADVEGLEKFVCEVAANESGPLRRSLELHFDMSVEELCQLSREALDET